MKIEVTAQSIAAQPADVVAVGVFEGETAVRGDTVVLDRALDGLVGRLLAAGDFTGAHGKTVVLHAPAGATFERVVLVGLGKRGELDVRRLVGATVAAASAAAGKKARRLAIAALGRGARAIRVAESVEAVAEGLERSTFRVADRQSDTEDHVAPHEQAVIAGLKPSETAAARRAAAVGQAIGAGANLARELANLPGNLLGPADLADRARAVAAETGLEVDILDENDMARLKMGAILSVGQGSDRPPRMVVLRHKGGGKGPTYGLVGKGITFDSGGVSIKPSEGMEQMKYDMSGAAAVLGAMHAIGRLRPKANVLGLLGCAENLPSGHASRPGDVVTARTGKTIEIVSTDAEGRLVLADTLAYAIEQGATHLVDLATLTGACIIALGHEAAGLMTNDARWAGTVTKAARRAGERVWELPLFPEYKPDIKSKIADIKNVGARRAAGTIAGGMFLKEFVGRTPWVHLDIAGTAWADDDKPHRPYGPTGFGVATLVRLVL